jgi:hypothetical protein
MTEEFETRNDSFENENEDQSPSWQDATDSEMASAQVAEESYSLEDGKKRLNRGTIIFMASCLLCVGVFYLFHLRQKPKQATANQQEVEAKVNQALSKLVDEKEQEKSRKMFEDTEEMVQAFYEYPTKQQVALKELQRNPFSLTLTNDEQATDEDDAKKRLEKLRAELTKHVGTLTLQSVLRGPRGSQCLINGEVYSEGEKVNDTFVIKSISNESVVVVAQKIEFVLQM